MVSHVSRVAVVVVMAGAVTHASGVALGFQGIGSLIQASEAGARSGAPAVDLAPTIPPVDPAGASAAARPSVALGAGGPVSAVQKSGAVKVPLLPRTSAGTQRVLNALDAFEDELRFYAGIGATELGQGPDVHDDHDSAGNIFGTLLPRAGEGPEYSVAPDTGTRGLRMAGNAVGTGLPAQSSGSGDTAGQIGGPVISFETGPPSRSGVAEPSPVPVPAGFPLLLAGIASFFALRR